MKRTFQPNNRKCKKTHGFLKRMSSPGGRDVISADAQKVERESRFNVVFPANKAGI